MHCKSDLSKKKRVMFWNPGCYVLNLGWVFFDKTFFETWADCSTMRCWQSLSFIFFLSQNCCNRFPFIIAAVHLISFPFFPFSSWAKTDLAIFLKLCEKKNAKHKNWMFSFDEGTSLREHVSTIKFKISHHFQHANERKWENDHDPARECWREKG